MELQRTIILVAIAIVTYMMVLAWQQDYGQIPVADTDAPTQFDDPPADVISADATPSKPSNPVPQTEDIPSALPDHAADPIAVPDTASQDEDRRVTVTTDVFTLELDRLGGDIIRVTLSDYPTQVSTPNQPFILLERSASRTYVAQSGIVGPNATDTAEGRPLWQVGKNEHKLAQHEFELNVDLFHRQDDGTEIIKRFTFERGSYLVRVSHIVRNLSAQPWQGALYGQIKRDETDDPGTGRGGFVPMPTFLGGAYWTQEKPYNKVSFSDMQKTTLKTTQEGGWIAFLQHYFLSAWIPDRLEQHTYSTHYLQKQNQYLLRFLSPLTVVQPGSERVLYAEFYVGPKIQDNLQAVSPGLDMTVDYGWLWFIAQPIFAVMMFIQSGQITIFGNQFDMGFGVSNWGITIILLTLFIKLLFFKLSAASYRSMARMRKVAPEMMRIKEEHKNDRQKQSMEMMKLYQTEKINPLGGCLPILVQMPVFISLYYVLLESVELRQAPFFGWIQDLSVMDPWFILPLLMGASMWFQMRLNPTPPDPTQAQVMKWMPIIFTFFFLWFPSGLVLYWLTNNILSIAQQWFITHRIENEGR